MRFFSRLFLLIFLASCYGSASEPDFDMALVEPPDSMVTLLTDVHLADGAVNVLKSKDLTSGHLSTEYFDAVLKKHELTREGFEESMRYYAYHTEELEKIYETVITDLSKKESLLRPTKDPDVPVDPEE